MIRSALRYPGGKFKAMPQIMKILPDSDIDDLREPFFGGGSFTLYYLQSHRKKPKRVTVGDLNTEIYNFWSMAQQNPMEVVECVAAWHKDKVPDYTVDWTRTPTESLPESFKEQGRELWDSVKNVEFSTLDDIQRAARLIIINHISFSSLGDSGTLSYDKFKELDPEKIRQKVVDVSGVLQGIDIRNCSYEEIMREKGENVFIFLDPPYLTQESSKLYGKDGDMHAGFPHEAFAQECLNSPYDLLITLDDCARVRQLYRDLTVESFRIPYTCGGKTSKDALAGEEVFIYNYKVDNGESYDILSEIL